LDEEVGQLFGGGPGALRPFCLPGDRAHAARQQQGEDGGGRDGERVPADELAHAVRPCGGTGAHRPALEVPGDVVPERLDRRVAAGGILLERAQADRVEVAGEPARELVGVARRAGGTLRALAPDGSRRETHFRTQRRRGGGERIALLYGIRVAARQELVQDEAEAVDVR